MLERHQQDAKRRERAQSDDAASAAGRLGHFCAARSEVFGGEVGRMDLAARLGAKNCASDSLPAVAQ